MNNIKKLYFNYTFNRANIIIIFISLLIIGVILNLYDFDISALDYSMDHKFYHEDFLFFSLQYVMPVAIVVIITIIIIDNISNSKRFDILFCTKIKSKNLLKIKIMVYLTLSFYYMSATYIMSMLIIRCTNLAYSAILVFIIYFISKIVLDINKYLGSLMFLNVDIHNKIAPLTIAGSIGIVCIYYLSLLTMYGKKELKLEK